MPTKEAGDVTATILVAPNLNEPLTPVYPTVPVTTAVSPAPFIDPSFNITVDNTCQGRQVIQIERALYELHRLSTDAIDILLKSSDSDLNKMYWGDHKKADLSTPVGVFHQLLEGSKTGVTIRCDEEEDKCKPEKVILAGGYVDKDRGTVHLCKSDFERYVNADLYDMSSFAKSPHFSIFDPAARLNVDISKTSAKMTGH